jgi:Flp pilus assembly protein TadG
MRKAVLAFLRCTSGNAALETVIVLPLALSLMAGSVEFGLALQAYLTAEKTVRSATRYLARVPATAVDSWGLTQARNLALTGTLDGTGAYLISTWQDANSIVLSHSPTSATPKVSLTATVPLRFELLTQVGLSPDITLTVTYEERYVAE